MIRKLNLTGKLILKVPEVEVIKFHFKALFFLHAISSYTGQLAWGRWNHVDLT